MLTATKQFFCVIHCAKTAKTSACMSFAPCHNLILFSFIDKKAKVHSLFSQYAAGLGLVLEFVRHLLCYCTYVSHDLTEVRIPSLFVWVPGISAFKHLPFFSVRFIVKQIKHLLW